MRRLESCAHFDADRIPKIFSSGEEVLYYRRVRRSFHLSGLNMGAPDRELLHTAAIQRVALLPGAHFRRCHAGYLSVEYICSGVLQFRQEDRGYELEKGELFLFQPGLTGDFYAVDQPCEKLSLVINGPLLGAYLKESALSRIDVLSGIDSGRFLSLIRDFEALAASGGQETERNNSFLTWRFLNFLRHPEPKPDIPRQLIHFDEFCRTRLAEPLTVKEMADACSLSESHFIRLCRQYFGETPYQYLLRLRMRAAVSLLLLPEQRSIKQIAAEVGYPNALNFSTTFKKMFGMSPREYVLRKEL